MIPYKQVLELSKIRQSCLEKACLFGKYYQTRFAVYTSAAQHAKLLQAFRSTAATPAALQTPIELLNQFASRDFRNGFIRFQLGIAIFMLKKTSTTTRGQDFPTAVIPFRLNRMYVCTIVIIHLLATLAFLPALFSWPAVISCLIGIHLFGQGITIGYHRLLTHRSFKTPKAIEHLFAILGICCLQDTPARWVTTHRLHHVHSDEIPDPHSPRVNFFWSHFGWLALVNRQTYSIASLEKFSKDLLRDPFYMKLELNPYRQLIYSGGQIPVFFALGFLINYLVYGQVSNALWSGLGFVVWGVFVRVVAVWHITWSVNSLSHMFGYRNYETDEDSRNNWLVALLTVGEGWHNNHHEDPSSASVQHRWWEVDISYYEIKLLERLGLASDVIAPRHLRHTT